MKSWKYHDQPIDPDFLPILTEIVGFPKSDLANTGSPSMTILDILAWIAKNR
jgi:hypothetical protein